VLRPFALEQRFEVRRGSANRQGVEQQAEGERKPRPVRVVIHFHGVALVIVSRLGQLWDAPFPMVVTLQWSDERSIGSCVSSFLANVNQTSLGEHAARFLRGRLRSRLPAQCGIAPTSPLQKRRPLQRRQTLRGAEDLFDTVFLVGRHISTYSSFYLFMRRGIAIPLKFLLPS
jgi:hypothetical protein